MTAAYTAGARRLGGSALPALLSLAMLVGCGRETQSLAEREKKQKTDFVSSLKEQGATVTEKDYPPYGRGYVVNLSGARLTDDTFRDLKGLKRLADLDLSRSTLTDEQMGQLDEVSNLLVRLDLSNTAVTDAGLEKLKRVYVLFNLNLVGTKVTPAGVTRFQSQRLESPHTRVKKTNVKLK